MEKRTKKKRFSLCQRDTKIQCDALANRKQVGKRKHVIKTGSLWTDSKYPLVRITAARFNMKLNQNDCSVLWQDSLVSAETCRSMAPYQRVNRFPGVSAFACKDLLAQHLNRMYSVFPNRYKIFPRTWCLPHDYANITAYAMSYPRKTFIIKPARGTEGRGIYITKNLKLIKPHERMICQVYINKPFLIDGYKFDLRVYALITSIQPLRLYVYNEGLTRFATKKYEEPSSNNMNDKFMHLTNYSVNRRSAFYVHDQKFGTKRSITTLNKWFAKNGYNVKPIWAAIDDAIVKTTLVALPTLKQYYGECFPNHIAAQACFQILGFDLILDHRLKPYVLEVNHSPSMSTPTNLDADVKSALMYDTFQLLNLKKDDRDRIVGFNAKLKKTRAYGDRPHRMYNNNEPENTDVKMREQFLRAQFRWEQNHLGNYRRVYPSGKAKKYGVILEYLERLKWPTLVRLPIHITDGPDDDKQAQQRKAAEGADLPPRRIGQSKSDLRLKTNGSVPKFQIDSNKATAHKSGLTSQTQEHEAINRSDVSSIPAFQSNKTEPNFPASQNHTPSDSSMYSTIEKSTNKLNGKMNKEIDAITSKLLLFSTIFNRDVMKIKNHGIYASIFFLMLYGMSLAFKSF